MESLDNGANVSTAASLLPTVPILAVNNSIVQIPTRENGMTAIVASDIKGPNSSVSDFGVANPISAKTEDATGIIQAARDSAFHRATELAGHIYQANHQAAPQTIDVTPNGNVFGPAPSRRALPGKNDGGGEKPISQKQTSFIQQLCLQKGVSVEDVCGKPSSEMTGREANMAIKKLQAQRNQ